MCGLSSTSALACHSEPPKLALPPPPPPLLSAHGAMQDVLCTAHSDTAAVLVTRWSPDITPNCLVPDCQPSVGRCSFKVGCTFQSFAQGAAHQHAVTALLVCLADAALLGQSLGQALSCPALFQVVPGPRCAFQAESPYSQARCASQAEVASDQSADWSRPHQQQTPG